MYKKLFGLILFLHISQYCFSQSVSQEDNRKIELGIVLSPDICYRYLNGKEHHATTLNFRNGNEKPKFGYSLGFNFIYHINKIVAIESGIIYSNRGLKVKEHKGFFPMGFDEPSDPEYLSFSYMNNAHYLDVPLKLNVYLINKNFKVYLTAGGSLNILIENNTIVNIERTNGETIKTYSDNSIYYHDFSISSIAGFGITYDLSQRMVLKAEPVFRYGITPANKTVGIKEHYYSLGLNTGLSLRF